MAEKMTPQGLVVGLIPEEENPVEVVHEEEPVEHEVVEQPRVKRRVTRKN